MQDEEEKWDEFRDLTELMRGAPRHELPEGFTARLMAKLPEAQAEGRFGRLRLLLGPLFTTTERAPGFRDPVTRTECAFYFLLTGFFHLVLGFSLLFGLHSLAGLLHPAWLSLQPVFGLLLAVVLSSLGFLLYLDGRGALRAARMGTILFAALVLLNGAIGAIWTRLPVAVYLAVLFSAAGLVMAAFLGIAVSRCAAGNRPPEEVRA